MKYLLDTSVIKELISPQPNRAVVAFVDSLDQEDLYLSVITVGELARAIQRSQDPQRKRVLEKWLREDLLIRFEGHILSLDANIFIRWGELSSKLEGLGIPRSAMESLIAATVLTHHLVLVTFDENDFTGTGVEVVNPW